MIVFQKLRRHKGHLLFAAAFVALSLASSAMPTSSAPDPFAGSREVVKCQSPDCVGRNAALGSVVLTSSPSKWGSPVVEDNFDRTSVGDNWYVYDSPSGDPKRDKNAVKFDGDFVTLQGLYQKGVNHAGSGMSQRYSQKYGRWEVRARADLGAGFSPTALLWPDDDNWPVAGEIDIFESPHGNRQKGIAVLHNKTTYNFKSQALAGSQVDWHTYAVDWFPDHVTFYVDDAEQWKVTDPKLIPTTSAMHLVLQNDAGCNWIECPNSSTKPVTAMQVDWIKVYAPPAS